MRLAACLVTAALFGGCAAHRPAAAGDGTSALERFIEKTRQVSLAARPPLANAAGTLEQRDPELAAARVLLAAAPSAAHHRLVGEAYARLGVHDAAYNQFAAALRLDPRDASSLDGLARVWRDWGFPHLGLSDVYRAIFYAPDSPVARNTLGTLLLNMGRPGDARIAFEQALALDPDAAYALNNLCYAWLLQGDRARAVSTCRGAVEMAPASMTAHNNLALAYAASDDLVAAAREFSLAGGAATARYNMGIALMATRRFSAAAIAFDEASALNPLQPRARHRAQQARQLAARTATAGTP